MAAADEKNQVPKDDPTSVTSEEGAADDDRKPISEEELHYILEQHHIWLFSDKTEGERACLDNRTLELAGEPKRNMRKVDLREAKLSNVKFANVDLSGADLRGADLTEAQFDASVIFKKTDFRGSTLQGAQFHKADLGKARLQSAWLSDANLGFVKNLLPPNLAGTVLTRAILPDDKKLPLSESIEHVNKLVKIGRATFFLMLSISIIVAFIVATTSDVDFVSGNSTKQLPLIEFDLPVTDFFMVAPIVLFLLYLYFVLYLIDLFENLSKLPAIFPDGRKLDQHLEPWIMISLVHHYFPHLNDNRPGLWWLRDLGASTIAWFVVPLVLLYTWWSYIKAHSYWLSFTHGVLLTAACIIGYATYHIARSRLRGETWPDPIKPNRRYNPSPLRVAVWAAIWLPIACFASYVLISAPLITNSSSDPFLNGVSSSLQLAQVDRARFLDVFEADISIRPSSWQDPLKELSGTESEEVEESKTGERKKDLSAYRIELRKRFKEAGIEFAELTGRDLRYLNAEQAFMVGAKLDQAELEGARLKYADLRGADLTGARARAAELYKADLRGANLANTELDGAVMAYAKLEHAILFQASMNPLKSGSESQIRNAELSCSQLREADLSHAELKNANLYMTDLSNAFLPFADLSGAQLLEANLSGADLSESDLSGAQLHGANLSGAKLLQVDLSGAQLHRANLSGADLSESDLSGAQLRGANLSGADLWSSIGLKIDQVNQACGDEETQLPKELKNIKIKNCEDDNGLIGSEGQNTQSWEAVCK